jgi:hypothetical protein
MVSFSNCQNSIFSAKPHVRRIELSSYLGCEATQSSQSTWHQMMGDLINLNWTLCKWKLLWTNQRYYPFWWDSWEQEKAKDIEWYAVAIRISFPGRKVFYNILIEMFKLFKIFRNLNVTWIINIRNIFNLLQLWFF